MLLLFHVKNLKIRKDSIYIWVSYPMAICVMRLLRNENISFANKSINEELLLSLEAFIRISVGTTSHYHIKANMRIHQWFLLNGFLLNGFWKLQILLSKVISEKILWHFYWSPVKKGYIRAAVFSTLCLRRNCCMLRSVIM